MNSRSLPRGTTAQPVCGTCAEYQRGERENVTYAGMQIHACERVPENWQPRECPCGCVMTPAARGGDATP